MISLFELGVTANLTLFDAQENMRLILDALLNGPSDNIAVDVRGPIFLAPFNGINTLDGGAPGFNLSRAIKCLTFDYGASFATHPDVDDADKIELINLQIEADEKAFLFRSVDTLNAKEVIVNNLYNSIVSVCWFGAEARHQSNQIDCHPAFVAAIDCFRRSPDANNSTWNFIVRIPASIGNTSMYFFNQMLTIRSRVTLLGDGREKTYLRFNNTSGITIAGILAGNTTGIGCTISDLNISAFYSEPFTRTLTRHGIIINITSTVQNVTISGFDGDGIHFVSSNNIGNANLSSFRNINVLNNLRNGVFVNGNDCNNVLFEHISVRDNGACGIRENFSLQCCYINIDSENNSQQEGNISRVSFEVAPGVFRRYVCHTDTPLINTLTPDSDPTHWFDIGLGATNDIYPVFNINVNYISGLAYRVIFPESRSMFLNCYAEDDGTLKKGVFGTIFAGNLNNDSKTSVLGGNLANDSVRGSMQKSGGGYYSQLFGVKDTEPNPTETVPLYRLAAPRTGIGEGSPQFGGLNTYVKVGAEVYSLTYQYYQHHPMFGFNLANTYSAISNPLNFIIKATLDSSVGNWYGAGRDFQSNAYCLSSFQMPIFMKEFGQPKYRLLGFAGQSPQTSGFNNGGITFQKNDFFINSNSSASNTAIAWRCIVDPDATHTNGQWETIHYFKPAEPANFVSTAAPTEYSQTQIESMRTEMEQLKAVLRTAGILKV